MPDPDATAIIKRTEALQARRSTYENHCEEVRELLDPGGDEFTTTSAQGAKAHQKVFDGTGEQASQMFAAGLMGLTSNPATNWFLIQAVNDRLNKPRDNAIWLEVTPLKYFSTEEIEELRMGSDGPALQPSIEQ